MPGAEAPGQPPAPRAANRKPPESPAGQEKQGPDRPMEVDNTQVHIDSEGSGDDDLFDGVPKRKFMDDFQNAASCTLEDLKEPAMKNAPHMMNTILRTRSRAECVYLRSHILEKGILTFVQDAEAAKRGWRVLESVEGYSVVQARGVCHAQASDYLMVDQVQQLKQLTHCPAFNQSINGHNMPLSLCYSSPQGASFAVVLLLDPLVCRHWKCAQDHTRLIKKRQEQTKPRRPRGMVPYNTPPD